MAACWTCMMRVTRNDPWKPHKCALGYGTVEEKEKKDRLAAALRKRIAMEQAVEAIRRVFKEVPDEHLEKVVRAIVKAAELED